MKVTVYDNFKVREGFKIKEFVCKCGCETLKLDSKLLDRLEMFRAETGVPCVITSGYRCPRNNKRVGGSKNSQHMKGTAVDIKIDHFLKRGWTYAKIVEVAKECGFTGIGLYDTFFHLDSRDRGRKKGYAFWDERVKNKWIK